MVNHVAMYEYLKNEYAPKVEQWAVCFRLGTPVNTNMFVESFHCLLKVVYFDNKSNRRIDQLLHVLVKIARNLVFEQIIKAEKGKLSHRKSEIHKRHKSTSELLGKLVVSQVQDGSYKVESLSKKMNTTLLKSFHRIVHANLIVPNAISAHTYIHVHAWMLLCIVLCVNMYICSV